MPTVSEVRNEKTTKFYAYGKNKRSQAWSPIHSVEHGLQDAGSRDAFYLSEAEAEDAVYEWLASKGRGRSAYEHKIESRDVSTERAYELRHANWKVESQQDDCLRELRKLQDRFIRYAEDVGRVLTLWEEPNTNGATEDERLEWLARSTEDSAKSVTTLLSNANTDWMYREARELRMALLRRQMEYSKYDPDPEPEEAPVSS